MGRGIAEQLGQVQAQLSLTEGHIRGYFFLCRAEPCIILSTMNTLIEFWRHPENFPRTITLIPWLISTVALIGVCLGIIQVHITNLKNKAQAEREKQLQGTIQSLETTIATEKEAKEKEEQMKRTPPLLIQA